MLASQKGYGLNGKQNFLFPLTDLYLTQGYGTDTYSHNGTYAMDFLGYYNGLQMANAPYFAPFDCTCVAKWGSEGQRIVWTSDYDINFIDGTVGRATIEFIHDDNAPNINVGDHKRQGEIIGHTGTYGPGAITGDHVHIEAKKGLYTGHHENSYGVYMLNDSRPLTDLIGVNDTTILHSTYRGVTYTWQSFEYNYPSIPGYVPKKKPFPWILVQGKKRRHININGNKSQE